MCGTIGIGAVITHQVVQLAETLPDRREAIKEKVTSAKQWVVGDGNSRFGQLIDDVTAIIAPKPANENKVVVEPASPLSSQVDTYLSPAAEILGQAAFTFILTVFMLLKREDLRNRMIRLTGRRQSHDDDEGRGRRVAADQPLPAQAVDDQHRVRRHHRDRAVRARCAVRDPVGLHRDADAVRPVHRHVDRPDPAGAVLVRDRAGVGRRVGSADRGVRAVHGAGSVLQQRLRAVALRAEHGAVGGGAARVPRRSGRSCGGRSG